MLSIVLVSTLCRRISQKCWQKEYFPFSWVEKHTVYHYLYAAGSTSSPRILYVPSIIVMVLGYRSCKGTRHFLVACFRISSSNEVDLKPAICSRAVESPRNKAIAQKQWQEADVPQAMQGEEMENCMLSTSPTVGIRLVGSRIREGLSYGLRYFLGRCVARNLSVACEIMFL